MGLLIENNNYFLLLFCICKIIKCVVIIYNIFILHNLELKSYCDFLSMHNIFFKVNIHQMSYKVSNTFVSIKYFYFFIGSIYYNL